MKTTLNQVESLEAVKAYAEMMGMEKFSLLSCGCAGAKFRGSIVRRSYCRKHEYKKLGPWPKDCPCGRVDRLKRRTQKAIMEGDDALRDRLRHKRLEHYEECYESQREGQANI